MFYVYCYFNPLKPSTLHPCGYEPFYVGKGKNQRLLTHVTEGSMLRDPNKHKTRTLAKIFAAGKEPIILIISRHRTEKSAWAAKKELIARWGRADLKRGPLTNMTDGGEGSAGKIFSAEYRAKLAEGTRRAIAAGKLDSNIAAFKMSRLGKKDSVDAIEKRVAPRRGKRLSDTTRAAISRAHKELRKTEEWKQIASAAQRGKKHSTEHTLKALRANPKTMPVEVNGIWYDSINKANAATGIPRAKLKKLAKAS